MLDAIARHGRLQRHALGLSEVAADCRGLLLKTLQLGACGIVVPLRLRSGELGVVRDGVAIVVHQKRIVLLLGHLACLAPSLAFAALVSRGVFSGT